MNSSRKLAFIYIIGFVISLYLILLICIQTSDVTRLNFSPTDQTFQLQQTPQKQNLLVAQTCHLSVRNSGLSLCWQLRKNSSSVAELHLHLECTASAIAPQVSECIMSTNRLERKTDINQTNYESNFCRQLMHVSIHIEK